MSVGALVPRAVRPILTGSVLAALLLPLAPAAAQTQSSGRLDLGSWSRRLSDNGELTIFECENKIACGEDSMVSLRLGNHPREAWTVARAREREQTIIKRMREQSEGRIKDIELGETRQMKIEEATLIYTEKKFIPAKGSPRTDIAGILTGKTKQYIIIGSAERPEVARNNMLGFARLGALILHEVARETSKPEAKPDVKEEKK